MKKMINAIFLVAGTAVGAGLISLPLATANVGLFWSLIVVAASFFAAYQTSCMAINLSVVAQKGLSIVELSQEFSGRAACIISMFSFYLLSFALLTVYFSATVSIASHFTNTHMNTLFPILCGLAFFGLFSLKIKAFNRANSFLFLLLVFSVVIILTSLYSKQTIPFEVNCVQAKDIFYLLPIMFTSFGVQNVCPFVFNYLDMDTKKVKRAFFLGILIAAVIYIVWIYTILNTVQASNASFYNRILAHDVVSGELVNFLCKFSSSRYSALFFEGLTLFAIITSAIGIGLGLIESLRGICKYRTIVTPAVIVVPVLTTIFVPNVFMNVLAFGGIIATIFVIFMPFYLTLKINRTRRTGASEIILQELSGPVNEYEYIISQSTSFGSVCNICRKYLFCILFGVVVVLAGFAEMSRLFQS
jgi:tyrosine-specific transport protein